MNHDQKICLISRWKLKNGLDEALLQTLQSLAAKVEAAEEHTLLYRVHLQANYPLDNKFDPLDPPAPNIPLSEQKEVVFVEVYKDAEAFSEHVKGTIFNEFLRSTLHYFQPDPTRGGWPVTENSMLGLQSGFERPDA